MRWIAVDTDFTDDPKIDAILRLYGRRENWAVGVLTRIWAYVGRHGGGPLEEGPNTIGAGVDSAGRPFSIDTIAAKVKAKPSAICQLMDRCAHEGHIDSHLWGEKKIIFFPAMQKRADGYTKKKLAKSRRNQSHTGGTGNNGSGGVSGQSPDTSRTMAGQSPDSVRHVSCTVPVPVISSTDVQERDRAREETGAASHPYEGPERRRPIDNAADVFQTEHKFPRAHQGDGAMAGGLPRDHLKCHRQPCGAICIPGRVHGDFLRQLGGENTENLAWLDAFYTRTLAGIPPGTKFGDRPLDFWRDHFAAAVPNIAPRTRRHNGGPDPAAMRTSAPDDKYDHLTRRATDDDQDQETDNGRKPS